MKGLVHIYTGDGKGKTTAAIGLIIRAVGQGLRCCYITFHKSPEKYNYGEIKVLKKLKIKIYNFVKSCPYFDKKIDIKLIKKQIRESIKFIKTELFQQNYQLIVLDEILICVREKFLDVKLIKDLLKSKPDNLELVLTGQANKRIINLIKPLVDYISYIKKLKHPYDTGIKRRKGIEF